MVLEDFMPVAFGAGITSGNLRLECSSFDVVDKGNLVPGALFCTDMEDVEAEAMDSLCSSWRSSNVLKVFEGRYSNQETKLRR